MHFLERCIDYLSPYESKGPVVIPRGQTSVSKRYSSRVGERMTASIDGDQQRIPVREMTVDLLCADAQCRLNDLLPPDWRLLEAQTEISFSQAQTHPHKKSILLPGPLPTRDEDLQFFAQPPSVTIALHEIGHARAHQAMTPEEFQHFQQWRTERWILSILQSPSEQFIPYAQMEIQWERKAQAFALKHMKTLRDCGIVVLGESIPDVRRAIHHSLMNSTGYRGEEGFVPLVDIRGRRLQL